MRQTRILVVDDEPAIRQSLCGVLEDEGFATHSVESGEACLEEVRRGGYDVVSRSCGRSGQLDCLPGGEVSLRDSQDDLAGEKSQE